MTAVLVLLIAGAGAWLAADRYDGRGGMALVCIGAALFGVAAVLFGTLAAALPASRSDNARATIAAATAAVARGTEEAELRNLERQAESAATAAAKGAGR